MRGERFAKRNRTREGVEPTPTTVGLPGAKISLPAQERSRGMNPSDLSDGSHSASRAPRGRSHVTSALPVGAGILVGVLMASQARVNGELSIHLGNSVLAATVNFSVGLAAFGASGGAPAPDEEGLGAGRNGDSTP